MASIAQRWRTFVDDSPGRRFENHYVRMRQQSTGAGAIVRRVLGTALVVAGVVGLFVPGPGLLALAVGVALLAEQSRTTARWLDRGEPRARRAGHAVERWWAMRSMLAQNLVLIGALVLLGGACYGAWLWLIS